MAKTITIEVTDSEYRCLEYAAKDPTSFITNAATFRARVAKDEIIPLLISHCNENGVTIATGEEAQIEQAYSLEVIKTGKQRDEEAQAAFEAKFSNSDSEQSDSDSEESNSNSEESNSDSEE